MSLRIPVFFFPIERDEVPENLDDWQSAMSIVGDRLESRDKYGLRTSISRNWWYQHAIGLICKGLAIEGLEFIDSEIACLDREELESAAIALDRVVQETRDGIPCLGPEIDKEGTIRWLHYYWVEGEYKPYSAETMGKAFEESQPAYDIDVAADVGYESVVGFYAFLKTLRAAVAEALSQNKSLLYVQPQP